MDNPFKVTIEKETKHDLWVEREETWDDGTHKTPMKSGYNHNNDYIGNAEDAEYLCEQRGIKPELIKDGNNVCSVGYSSKEGKWFGWSHRAIAPFNTREEAVSFAEEVS